ncbi:MAG: hypothetical protein AAGB51_02980 [Planctomycetota bacterium]
MNNSQLFIGIGALSVAALGGVWLGWPALRPTTEPTTAAQAVTNPESSEAHMRFVSLDATGETRASAVDALSETLFFRAFEPENSPVPMAAEGLADSAISHVVAYMFEQESGFISTFEHPGITWPDDIDTREELSEFWRDWSKVLANAEVDPEASFIRARYYEGEDLAGSQTEIVASRRTRAPHLADPKENGLTVYEVALPGIYSTASGDRFEGEIGFFFTYDQAAHEWIMTHSFVRGHPDDAAVLPLPL